MTAITQHFLVGNGDMSLIELESGRRVLIDINIRTPDESIPDVLEQLRDALDRDEQGRLYVDAMLLTHPDEDHCRGFKSNFHTGPADQWSKIADKIFIREIWSSPIVFKRASAKFALCDDAKAWSTEARRRVAKFRASSLIESGDRIQILGEDTDGKTDDLSDLLIKVDEKITLINGAVDNTFSATLLGPLDSADEDEEDTFSKNNSSVILQAHIASDGNKQAGTYLLGGDAEVAVWEALWKKHKAQPSVLEYEVLIAPHHCSWHSLSHDSWSALGEKVQVSVDARSALSQAMTGARILSSSKKIADDDSDPPCIRAKREYVNIVENENVGGQFRCLADEPGQGPFKMEVTKNGPRPKRVEAATLAGASTTIGREPIPHG